MSTLLFFKKKQIGFLIFLFVAASFFGCNVVYAAPVSWSNATVQSGITAEHLKILFDVSRAEYQSIFLASGSLILDYASSASGAPWGITQVDAFTFGVDSFSAPILFTTSTAVSGITLLASHSAGNVIFYGSGDNGASFSAGGTVIDKIYSGAIQGRGTSSGRYALAGSMLNGDTGLYDVEFATTTGSTVRGYTTSTVASGFSKVPTVDFVYQTGKSVIAYADGLDNILHVATSTDGPPWTSYDFVTPYSGNVTPPHVKVAADGTIWIAYEQSNGRFTNATINLLHYDPVLGWVNEVVDTLGVRIASLGYDLSLINGTTPVLAYSSHTSPHTTLRIAYRNGIDSGCLSGSTTMYSCSDVATGADTIIDGGGSGNKISVAAGSGENAAVEYSSSSDGGAIKVAYADLSPLNIPDVNVAHSGIYAPVSIVNPMVVINEGATTTTSRYVRIHLAAHSDAGVQSMSLSSDPSFYGQSWQSFQQDSIFDLGSSPGLQRVYAKFANNTGAVSTVTFAEIMYEPDIVNAAPQAAVLPPVIPVISSAPPISSPPTQPVFYDYYSGPEVQPFISETPAPIPATTESQIKVACPERANAFSIGGRVLQINKTGKLYVAIDALQTLCEIPDKNVLASWGGKVQAHVATLPAYRFSTPLPFRPRTIVRASNAATKYFVNTKGELQAFPSNAAFIKLGYTNSPSYVSAKNVLAKYDRSAALVNSAIHPDGTLFVLNKSQGEYAILQERTLHTISLARLKLYGERPTRAITLQKGESYPLGKSWN